MALIIRNRIYNCLKDKIKVAHEKAVDELQILLDKKKALQTDELMQAISKSEKTFEEIMRFIEKG